MRCRNWAVCDSCDRPVKPPRKRLLPIAYRQTPQPGHPEPPSLVLCSCKELGPVIQTAHSSNRQHFSLATNNISVVSSIIFTQERFPEASTTNDAVTAYWIRHWSDEGCISLERSKNFAASNVKMHGLVWRRVSLWVPLKSDFQAM